MKRLILTNIVILLLLLTSVVYAGSNSTSLPNGAILGITIDDPVTCTNLYIPAGGTNIDVDVSGSASVGEGVPDALIIYVMDISGSTEGLAGGDCGPDQNPGDPESTEDEVIDCEIASLINLTNEAINLKFDQIAVATFAGSALTADMTPIGGDDPIIDPVADDDTNGQRDIDEVLHSVRVAEFSADDSGIWEFTIKTTADIYGTNYGAGISEALAIASSVTKSTKIVVFVSDGFNNKGPAVDTLLPSGDVVFHTFAVGSNADCESDPDGLGSLQDVADLTLGTCTEVADPTALPTILPDFIASALDSLEIEVDGGGKTAIGNDDIEPDLPQDGPVTVNFTTTAAGLGIGDHVICVTANGHDSSGSGSVDQCETIHVIQIVEIDIKPGSYPNSINLKRETGVIPVAILGSDTFDVTNIDVTTLVFATAMPAHNLTEALVYMDHLQDVNYDGFTDLVSHYVRGETNIISGDTEACISADLITGGSIAGCDSIRTLH